MAGERGSVPVTYIRGGAFVGTWAGEGDELMAPLVHDKTADCKREKKGRTWGGREGRRQGGKRGNGGKEIIKPGLHNKKGLTAE